jgi:hypothetical protein
MEEDSSTSTQEKTNRTTYVGNLLRDTSQVGCLKHRLISYKKIKEGRYPDAETRCGDDGPKGQDFDPEFLGLSQRNWSMIWLVRFCHGVSGPCLVLGSPSNDKASQPRLYFVSPDIQAQKLHSDMHNSKHKDDHLYMFQPNETKAVTRW